jgi:hypothetical protein
MALASGGTTVYWASQYVAIDLSSGAHATLVNDRMGSDFTGLIRRECR